MAGTKFKLREIFRFSLLICFVFVVGIVVDADSSDLGQSQTPNPIPVESDGSELSSVFRRLAQLEQKNQEYEKLNEEMKVLKEQVKSLQESCDAQAKSLSEKLSGVESKISEDGGLWLLTPPVRGPPGRDGKQGEKGDKGDRGLTGSQGNSGPPGKQGDPGKTGERGLQGEKGDEGQRGIKGQGFPDSKLITSCSAAMTMLPFAPQRLSIYPHGNSKRVEVLCDFETDGGGWTIIQKRTTGPKGEFKQNWNDYAKGFGSLDGNFWLGLENIRTLTKNGDQELRIELEDFDGNRKYAKYSRFSISDASDFYRLTLGGFSEGSTLRDSLTEYHNGQRFTTIDRDNDNSGGNCALQEGGGGWWFSNCGLSNLNGLYFDKGEVVPGWQGIYWYSWKGDYHSLAKSEMKIRKRKP